MGAEEDKTTLKRSLTRFDAISILIGGIIGSGIFATPGLALQAVNGAAGVCLLLWCAGACVGLCTGFVWAELAGGMLKQLHKFTNGIHARIHMFYSPDADALSCRRLNVFIVFYIYFYFF